MSYESLIFFPLWLSPNSLCTSPLLFSSFPCFFKAQFLISLTCNVLQKIDNNPSHATTQKGHNFISRIAVIWRFCLFRAVRNRLAGDFAFSELSEIVSLEILPFPSCRKPSRWRFCLFRAVRNRLAGDFAFSVLSETVSADFLPFPNRRKSSPRIFCLFRTVGNRLRGFFAISEPSETVSADFLR